MRLLSTLIRTTIVIVGLVYVAMAQLSQLALANTDRPKILVLGDSLSAAYGISAERGWVSLFQQRLTEQGSDIKIINASVSGATTSAGLSILPGLLERHRPQWVFLELGANDGLQGKPIGFIEQQLDALITLTRKGGAEPIVFGMELPPNYGDRYTGPFSELFPAAAERHDALYVPFLLNGVAGTPELMQADGLHPTAEAQSKVFENVWQSLSSVSAFQLGSERLPKPVDP